MSSPWRELLSCAVASAIGDAVVIDVTNPLTEDFMGTTIGRDTSPAVIAALLLAASVVKGFNTIFADTMTRPVINGVAQVVPVAGDDPEAKVLVLVVV